MILCCNIPCEIGWSIFTGIKEGFGQIFLTLRCSIFDASQVFDHTAQLVETLKIQDLTPAVFILQTNSGVDRDMSRLQTKLAIIALFPKMDFDHLLIIHCAPNGSAYDKVYNFTNKSWPQKCCHQTSTYE